MLFAPVKHAFVHRPAGLRHRVVGMARGAAMDGAAAALAGFGFGIVLRNMRRDAGDAQIRHVTGGVISLVLTHADEVGPLMIGRD